MSLTKNADVRWSIRKKKPNKLFDAGCEDCGWVSLGWTTAAMARLATDHHRDHCPKATTRD